MAKNPQTILSFIESFKVPFREEIEFTFYRGQCYWFAFILSDRFKGTIWFNPKIVHFASCIDDVLYDIYGRVIPGICPVDGSYDGSEYDWVSWTDFQLHNQDTVQQIVDSCIKKMR